MQPASRSRSGTKARRNSAGIGRLFAAQFEIPTITRTRTAHLQITQMNAEEEQQNGLMPSNPAGNAEPSAHEYWSLSNRCGNRTPRPPHKRCTKGVPDR